MKNKISCLQLTAAVIVAIFLSTSCSKDELPIERSNPLRSHSLSVNARTPAFNPATDCVSGFGICNMVLENEINQGEGYLVMLQQHIVEPDGFYYLPLSFIEVVPHAEDHLVFSDSLEVNTSIARKLGYVNLKIIPGTYPMSFQPDNGGQVRVRIVIPELIEE
jgi:hypothetical protein